MGGRWASPARAAARSTSSALPVTGRPRAKLTVSSMPTRRWPPADSAASLTGSVVRPIPVADHVAPRRPGRQRRNRLHERGGVARHATGDPHHQVTVDMTAVRGAEVAEQPVEGGHVTEVEEFELGHDAPFLGPRIELADEGPRVAEHL